MSEMKIDEAGRKVTPQHFLSYLRQCGGIWLTERLRANGTCSCGSCHMCMFHYAESLLAELEATLAAERQRKKDANERWFAEAKAMRKKIDVERAAREKAEADAAAMREAILSSLYGNSVTHQAIEKTGVCHFCQKKDFLVNEACPHRPIPSDALATNAGQPLLDELARLRRLLERWVRYISEGGAAEPHSSLWDDTRAALGKAGAQ